MLVGRPFSFCVVPFSGDMLIFRGGHIQANYYKLGIATLRCLEKGSKEYYPRLMGGFFHGDESMNPMVESGKKHLKQRQVHVYPRTHVNASKSPKDRVEGPLPNSHSRLINGGWPWPTTY